MHMETAERLPFITHMNEVQMSDENCQVAEQRKEKVYALAAMHAALATFEGQNRQLDAWERVCMVKAMAMMFRGFYDLAALDAELALAPPDQRSRTAKLPSGGIYDRCDLPLLRKVLAEAEAASVEPQPLFAPIVLT